MSYIDYVICRQRKTLISDMNTRKSVGCVRSVSETGMTSPTTPHVPPIIADFQTLVNCCTAELPPIMTLLSI